MAYSEFKDTSNPFVNKLLESWDTFRERECSSVVETITKWITQIVILAIIACLIPIGVIISIYNSLYNLQKESYDKLVDNSDNKNDQFADTVVFGVYLLFSIPFLVILIPFWIIEAILTWFAKHKVLFIILIVLFIGFLKYRQYIIPWILSIF